MELNGQKATTEFIIGWRKNFLDVGLTCEYHLDNEAAVYEAWMEGG